MNTLKKYGSVFRIRFLHGLQYRAAALAGVATQFAWGFLTLLLFQSFYRADPAAFPMDFQAMVSYIWLQQAFLALYMLWFFENDIFEAISGGNLAYELCRPADLYSLWYARGLGLRLSRAVLRCLPVLLVAALVPQPFRMGPPAGPWAVTLFLLSMVLALLVVCALGMLVYAATCFTLSPMGIRILMASLAEFLSGALIPLPFLPDGVRQVVELLPFASAQNVPFRVYSGDLAGMDALAAVGLQVFWLAALVLLGRALLGKALRRAVVQGG